MNDNLTCIVYWLLMAAFMLGATPCIPVKSQISSRKTVRILAKLGVLRRGVPVTTTWTKTCRLRLRTTAMTATYFFIAQAVLFSPLAVWLISRVLSEHTSGSNNFTWNAMEHNMHILYLWSMVSTSTALAGQQKMQRFLDSWLLLSSLGLDFVQEKNLNSNLAYILDAMNEKVSSWSSSRAFGRAMIFTFVASGASVAAVGLVDPTWAARSGTAILIVQFRANLGAILYMLVAASSEDKISHFNLALKDVIPTATPKTVKDLIYFCQAIRDEERNCQDVLRTSVASCHLQRITCFVFNITNLMFYFRQKSLDVVLIFQSIPMFAYNSLALSIFYILGDRCAAQINNTKRVLRAVGWGGGGCDREIAQLRDVVSDDFYFTAGKIVRFSLEGGWLDVQFMFTVITVLIQLYESE